MKPYDFTVISGLDGVGKGAIEKELVALEDSRGKRVFDTVAFSIHHGRLPAMEEFAPYDILLTAEPTRSGIGRVIREEVIARNGRDYSSEAQIQLYSLDRLVQLQSLVIPALRSGKRVIQSRCFAETLNYQLLEAIKEGKDAQEIRKRVLAHEGNVLELEYSPTLLIIPTVNDVDELMRRIEARKVEGKDDNCVFENLEFQRRLKPLFEDVWLKSLFESSGSIVRYLDAGISVEETRRQAREIYTEVFPELSQKVVT